MPDKLIVGPFNRGLTTNREPFVIDNDAFPVLINAYQWRGRIKRKRGTESLARLQRLFNTQSIGTSAASPWTFNLYSSLTPPFTPESNSQIVPGSVQILFNPTTSTGTIVPGPFAPGVQGYTIASDCEVFSNTLTGLSTGSMVNISGVIVIPGSGPNIINGGPYTVEVIPANTSFKLGVDSHAWGMWQSGGTWVSISGSGIIFKDQGNGTLTSTTPGNSGTINYTNGQVTLIHTAGSGVVVDATFSYYPGLPCLGLLNYTSYGQTFPGTIAFDTTYSYAISTSFPYPVTDVSFYKNPPSEGSYITKTTNTALTWNGEDYQQFGGISYQGALFVTNGVPVPFSIDNIGMQFAPAGTITYTSNTATTLVVTITGSPLVIGDFVFVNEWTGTNAVTLNFQSGYVTAVAGTSYTITFPDAAIGAGPYTPGIIQYLTNRSDTTKDCIRWYDGTGWVNFMPPLSRSVLSIADTPVAQYYLVGAKIITSFKDRLVFFGPVIQSSSGVPIYLNDTAVFSENGTPFYTASFDTDPSFATTEFFPILVPTNQSAIATAFWSDQTGYGGWLSSGLNQPANTASPNHDALIVGFSTYQTRFVYTGNDLSPFDFLVVNSEYGSSSTFSTINRDDGVMTRGSRGYIITNQNSSQRFDLEDPDQVFEIDSIHNGFERFCAHRDFINEWIYFSYPSNQTDNTYNDRTFFYNYRDDSWAIFNESFSCYGTFYKQTGQTWDTLPSDLTWDSWNDPWDSGISTLEKPTVIGGNQQGFVIIKGVDTSEAPSLFVYSITFTTNPIITSPNHNLVNNDYITFTNVLGVAGLNGAVFSVNVIDTNTFSLNGGGVIPVPTSGTYIGAGLITKLFSPFIQTKQFPIAWDMGRKTRLGVQKYLLTRTDSAQIQLLIYLSTDPNNPYNNGPIVPTEGSFNNGLIFSSELYTCPESCNLGLTPANSTLMTITEIAPDGNNATSPQQQIWHRINTSLIGDTVQLGFTMSDAQMRDQTLVNQTAEIELHGFIIDISSAGLLA